MDAKLFDYSLPPELIAQTPALRRDASRLLVFERKSRKIEHRRFCELPDILPTGTRLFRNDAAVLQARLPGVRSGGGKVECLLLRPGKIPTQWWCLLKPGKKASTGSFGVEGVYKAHVVDHDAGGEYLVEFEIFSHEGTVLSVSKEIGKVPLPPYITRARPKNADFSELDKERYQTVYAHRENPVAAAAPTAGLHFSQELLQTLKERNFKQFDLTLHIGLGTFQPMKSAKVEGHKMHGEFYSIPRKTREELERKDSPRLAVGTTSLRAMEDFVRRSASGEQLVSSSGDVFATAELFVFPPQEILSAEFLLTNFHLPRSTLMCLVSTFLTPNETRGIELLKELYAEAIALKYRFYSYGDAMLIL